MQTIRNILAGLALAIAATCGACVPPSAIEWPEVARCGTDAAAPLFDTVSTVLLTDKSPGDALDDLARDHGDTGAEVLACVVEQVVRGFLAQESDREARMVGAGLSPSPDAARVKAAARGRAFLEARGVTVELEEPGGVD